MMHYTFSCKWNKKQIALPLAIMWERSQMFDYSSLTIVFLGWHMTWQERLIRG